jgi:hypothetical protein
LHLCFGAARINALLDARDALARALENNLECAQRNFDSYGRDDNAQDQLKSREVLRSAQQFFDLELEDQKVGTLLSKVLPGARGPQALLDSRVLLRRKKTFHEVNKLLVSTSDKIVLEDIVACVEGNLASLDGVVLCAKNAALFDGWFLLELVVGGRRLLVLWQDKHSELDSVTDTVSVTFVRNWYAIALASTSDLDVDVALLFFTNRRLTSKGDLASSISSLFAACPRLLLVSRTEISTYLQLFAHRGLLALEDTLVSPNQEDNGEGVDQTDGKCGAHGRHGVASAVFNTGPCGCACTGCGSCRLSRRASTDCKQGMCRGCCIVFGGCAMAGHSLPTTQ